MRKSLPMKFGFSLPGNRSGSQSILLTHQAGVLWMCILFLGMAAPRSYGTVQSQPGDDVIPADNPFTVGTDEGLPDLGNSINPFEGPTAVQQTNFEGEYDVVVGKSGFGTLLISGGSDIRAEHLIIGDSEMPVITDASATAIENMDLLGDGMGLHGSGVVRIEGFSSLYNSQYDLLPPGIPGGYAAFGSNRETDSGAKNGFDVYVGRWGNGRLEIVAGGRAEIDDAVVVGDFGGSVGLIEVDGIDSFLSNAASDGIIDQTQDAAGITVGRLGSGTMNIINRGLVFSRGFNSSSGGGDIVAAVIGSDRYDGTAPPDAGGVGNVFVDGIGSTWVVAGNLQIGGFHANHDPVSGDLEGDDVDYASNVGRGTLTISNGGLVSVVPPEDVSAGMAPDELDVLVGRLGTIDLQGGRIELQSGFEQGGGNPNPLIDDVQLINDGTIKGSGRIDTGIFANRYHGRVELGAGDSLIVDSTSDGLPPMHREPLVNWGVIEVHGTADAPAEIEFDHVPDLFTDIGHAFHNYRLTNPPPAPVPADIYGGLISAQHATLRFRSGLDNHAIVAVTAGTNYFSGNVLNEGALSPLGEGRINVWGSDVVAIFENELNNLGTLDIAGGADVEVLGRHSFITAGNLSIELDADDLSQIFVAGDAGITGRLTVSLTSFGIGSLTAGDSFEIISVTGQLGGVDLTNPIIPQVDLTVPPLFTELVIPNLSLFGAAPGLELIPVYTANSVLLAVFSTVGLIGADFNGDGIVDNLDLDIWRMNFGITMGATALQGDANGDGRVDGRDFFIWQSQVGGPGMGAGAGAGGLGGGNVPEPSSLLLALCGGLLSLAASRRRRSRVFRS